MPVSVQCPACQKQFNVKDEYAGRVGRCTACKATFTMTPTGVKTLVKEAVKTSDSQAVKPASNGGAKVAAPTPAPKAAIIGRFQIRKKLGAGAFGTVYRAYDPQLEREVALKVPQPGVLSTPQRVERFLREAKASAQLTHPAIVPVYDAGTDGGRHYIASKFIDGKPLADAAEEGSLDPKRAARIVAELGDALFYAHMLGVVHRDIKPANVMLDIDDHPHLMDFGLASWESSTEKLTHDGAVLGTPAYMSPEQAGGQQGEAKMESDQYSLGVVLYELLTGRTPFEGPPQIMIHAVINKEPPRPGSIKKGIPRDLETICMKAMAKQPKDRYGNCQELARDLRRWLDGEPILARRLGIVERASRWARKEPMLASAGGVIALLLVALAGVLTWKVGVLASEVSAEQKQKSAAMAAAAKAESDLAAEAGGHLATKQKAIWNDISALDSLVGSGKFGLAHWKGQNIPAEMRGFEANHLIVATEGIPAAARLFNNRDWVQAAAFNAKSTELVCACNGGRVEIHDLLTGKSIRNFELPGGWEQWQNARFALSGNGERLVTVRIAGMAPQMSDGFQPAMQPMPAQNPKAKKPLDEASVWDVATGKKILDLKAKLNPGPAFVAVNEDGSKIALATGGKYELALYDGRTGDVLHPLDGCTLIKSLAFDPSGGTLFAVDGGETTVILQREGTRNVEKVEKYTETVDGQTVVKERKVTVPETFTFTVNEKVCVPNSIKTWDVATGAAKTPLASRPTTQRLALTCDGAQAVLLGSSQQMIARTVAETVMQTVKQKKMVEVKGQKKWVEYEVAAPMTVTKMVFEMVGGAGDVTGLPIDDVATGQETAVWDGVAGIASAAFSPDCQRVATVEADHCRHVPVVQLWDAKTRAKTLALRLPADVMFFNINWLAWSPDSQHLAGWGMDGRIIVWSAVGRRSLVFRDDLGPVSSVAWSPDGKQLAAVSDCTSRGVVLDPSSGKTAFNFFSAGVSGPSGGIVGGGCLGLSFLTDSRQLVRNGISMGAGCYGGMSTGVLRWTNPAGKEIEPVKDDIHELAVSRDGARLVTVEVQPSGEGTNPVIRSADGNVVAKLAEFRLPAEHVQFSPDGKYLAATSVMWDNGQRRGDLRVYNAATGAIVVKQDNAAGVFAFSADSRQLASATAMIMPMMIMPPPGVAPKEASAAPKDEAFNSRGTVLVAMLEPGEKPEPATPQPKRKKIDDDPKETIPEPAPKGNPPKGVPALPKEMPKPVMPEVKVFNLSGGSVEKTIKDLTFGVRRLEFSPDGKNLAILSLGLRLVDLASNEDILVADDASGAFLFANDRLVYAGKPLPPTAMPAPAPGAAPVGPNEVSFQEPIDDELAPPGPACYPGMPNQPATSMIKIWSTSKRGEVSAHFMLGSVTAMTVNGAGDRIAVATLGGPLFPVMTCGGLQKNDSPPLIHVLTADGQLATAFHGHSDRVNCLAFDPASERLATASEDGTFRAWSLTTFAK